MNRTEHKAFATNVLGVSEQSYDSIQAHQAAKNEVIRKVRAATMEELDDIIERTEYTDGAVALGEAANDQMLRRAAQHEIEVRTGMGC